MNYLKKTFFVGITLLMFACSEKEHQSSITGEIKNLPKEIKEVILKTPSKIKRIKIENGAFKDTISVNGKYCFIQIGGFKKTIFLNQDTQLHIYLDANNYTSLNYSGSGKEVNNYLNEREAFTERIFQKTDSINQLNEDEFENFQLKTIDKIESLLKEYDNIDPYVINTEKENLKYFIDNIVQQYNKTNTTKSNNKIGSPSPEFSNYENFNGGMTSLRDLRGSYVYIDIWATWCPPCKAEIPFLKNLEEKLKNNNIKFVSISVDSKNAKEAWKKMIKKEQMSGVQLFANGDRGFMEAYQVTGIPRFILLDKEGNIINPNAPRPSDPNLFDILSELK